MSCEKKETFCTLSSYFWLNDMNYLPPKIDKFSYFYHSSPFERDIIFKEPLFVCKY